MRVIQHKYIDIGEDVPLVDREPCQFLPEYWGSGSKLYGYIPNKQSGWAGPIISYWARLDTTNRYFS